MKHENEFDELARRKLEERTFPYDGQLAGGATRARSRAPPPPRHLLVAGCRAAPIGRCGHLVARRRRRQPPATTEVANTTATPEVNAIPEAPTAESTTNAPEAPASLSVKASDQHLTPQRTSANSIDAPVEEKTKKGSIKRTPAASAHTSTASTPAPTKADVQQPKPASQRTAPPAGIADGTPMNTVNTEPSSGNATSAGTPPLEPEPTPSIAATTGTLTPQEPTPRPRRSFRKQLSPTHPQRRTARSPLLLPRRTRPSRRRP